jgi:hypothetical protein
MHHKNHRYHHTNKCSTSKLAHLQHKIAKQLKRLRRIVYHAHNIPEIRELTFLFKACRAYWTTAWEIASSTNSISPISQRGEQLITESLRFVRSVSHKLRESRQSSSIQRWISNSLIHFEFWKTLLETLRTRGVACVRKLLSKEGAGNIHPNRLSPVYENI